MKPTLLLLLIFLTSFTPNESNVYICKSKTGKKYHNKENCRGLNSWTHKIEKVSLKAAKAAGKTLCGWED